tara:strand:+ start:407 stop:931 length:525 start_codon:yes stop_codon:yes gene_type:complete
LNPVKIFLKTYSKKIKSPIMNQLFPLLHLEEVGAGGLFDFGATLPLLALQFVILTVVLNGLLYDPLLNTINDRNDYIVNNLSEASSLIKEASSITEKYELDLQSAKKQIQLDIIKSQKKQKEVWDLELQNLQQTCNTMLRKLNVKLLDSRIQTLLYLDKKIDTIGSEILGKLFI